MNMGGEGIGGEGEEGEGGGGGWEGGVGGGGEGAGAVVGVERGRVCMVGIGGGRGGGVNVRRLAQPPSDFSHTCGHSTHGGCAGKPFSQEELGSSVWTWFSNGEHLNLEPLNQPCRLSPTATL